RALAAAVDADETDAVAGADAPGHAVEDGAAGPAAVRAALPHLDGHVLHVVDGLAEPRGREPGQLHRVARRRLVGDQRLRGLHPELRLGRAGLRAAPQPRQLLAQQVLPLGLRGGGDAGALGLGEDVRGVAALVALDAAV